MTGETARPVAEKALEGRRQLCANGKRQGAKHKTRARRKGPAMEREGTHHRRRGSGLLNYRFPRGGDRMGAGAARERPILAVAVAP